MKGFDLNNTIDDEKYRPAWATIPFVFFGLLLPFEAIFAVPATIDELAREAPERELLMHISFRHIQRAPAIIDLLSGSGLILEQVKYKNVGSGGGQSGMGDPFGRSTPLVDTPEKVKAALDRIEEFRSNHYRNMAKFNGGLREVDCPYDDLSAPVKDTHGRPEEPSIELSCGLRIVSIQVRGAAQDGARTVSSHPEIANVIARPNKDYRVDVSSMNAPAPRADVKLSDDELIEAAKLGLAEKLYERAAATYRGQLAGRNLSEDEIEDRLYRAIDAYALCTARAAFAQAREQGLSVEIVLKGFGTGTRGKEESLVFLQLDLDALKQRTASCNKVLYDNLGLSFY